MVKEFGPLKPMVFFPVQSLVTHLSRASPLDINLKKALWSSSSPQRVNISVWIMLFGHLNCASVLQRKMLQHCLSPSICPLCLADRKTYSIFFIIIIFMQKNVELIYFLSSIYLGYLEALFVIMFCRF